MNISDFPESKLALIPQGAAYGLLIGLSVLFCGVILIAVKVQKAVSIVLDMSGQSKAKFKIAGRRNIYCQEGPPHVQCE
jgi:hypothetical protein